MPTMKYKSNQNEDTAYCDGHKVQLIAVPAGTLQKPIHATSDAGYVVDGNGNKHRVLMAVFLSGTPDYKPNETSDTAYLTVNGQKVKVRLASKENGTLTLSDSANVNKGYAVGTDGEKHRVLLVNTPSGTLELPNSETDDSAYVIDNGKKTKVRMFVLINGAGIEVVVGPAVSPLSLPDAVANSLSYVKAYGGLEQNGTPTPTSPVNIVCNNGTLKVKDSELPVGYKRLENIKTTGNVRYVSNVYLTGGDTLRFSFQASPGNLLGSYNDSSANNNYSFYNATGSSASYARYNGQTGGSATYTGTTYNVTMSPTGIIGIRNPSSFTPREFTCSVPFCIFATSPTGSEHSNATIIGSIEVSGSQTLKFIPCERVSDGAIGFWETSNQEFLENQENGTPTTDGYDTSYMTEVYVDGTVETIEDSIGNTATCEPLLAVGDYTDVQEILSGAVTRNVGIKVLTGEENFETATATNCYSLTNTLGTGNFSDRTIACSHFGSTSTLPGTDDRQGLAFVVNKGSEYTIAFGAKTQFSTQTQWKNWLAAQAAAGTPVIVVYPLATAITESVTGQTLQVQAGDNTLEITQASLNNLELEAKYMKEE